MPANEFPEKKTWKSPMCVLENNSLLSSKWLSDRHEVFPDLSGNQFLKA